MLSLVTYLSIRIRVYSMFDLPVVLVCIYISNSNSSRHYWLTSCTNLCYLCALSASWQPPGGKTTPKSTFVWTMQLPDPAAPPALQLPPAAIQNITPIDESEQLDVTLSLVSLEGATSSLKCCRHSTLRSLQRNLCASFGKNYPHTAAAVCIEHVTYADFDDVPFLATVNHQVVNVIFLQATSRSIRLWYHPTFTKRSHLAWRRMLLGTAIGFRRNKPSFEGLVLGTALYSGILQLRNAPTGNRGYYYVTTSTFAWKRPWCTKLYLCIFNITLRRYVYFIAERLISDHLSAIWQNTLVMRWRVRCCEG